MYKKNILSPSIPAFWENYYQSGEIGWDLGGPTPIFNQWIKTCNKPLTICILGAGNGWDAINFALYGHNITAVDFAKSPVQNMKRQARNYGIKMNVLHRDIFSLSNIFTSHFDVVLEYTCFCAISPVNRRNYIEMVQHILKPNGKLVGLLFPVEMNKTNVEPPYPIDLDKTIKLFNEYLYLIEQKVSTLTVSSRTGREVFVIFKKHAN